MFCMHAVSSARMMRFTTRLCRSVNPIKDFIDSLYPVDAAARAGKLSRNEVEESFHGGKYSPVFGELTFEAGEEIFGHALRLLEPSAKPAFVDLGSGLGKLCIQAALTRPNKLSRILGIELSRTRHEIAEKALKELGNTGRQYPPMEFLNQDFMQVSLPSSTPSIVFCASLTFPSDVVKAVGNKCMHELATGSILYSFRSVEKLSHLQLKDPLHVSTSWGVRSPLKVYRIDHN